uniref:Putative cnidarian restricted protein n=1 Tax=Clytia hemisphaerica TaxID=252671 RepID=A0A069DNJ3_9CNID
MRLQNNPLLYPIICFLLSTPPDVSSKKFPKLDLSALCSDKMKNKIVNQRKLCLFYEKTTSKTIMETPKTSQIRSTEILPTIKTAKPEISTKKYIITEKPLINTRQSTKMATNSNEKTFTLPTPVENSIYKTPTPKTSKISTSTKSADSLKAKNRLSTRSTSSSTAKLRTKPQEKPTRTTPDDGLLNNEVEQTSNANIKRSASYNSSGTTLRFSVAQLTSYVFLLIFCLTLFM